MSAGLARIVSRRGETEGLDCEADRAGMAPKSLITNRSEAVSEMRLMKEETHNG